MNRIGIFAATAALVLLSALHMLNAPNYWIAFPAIMFGYGLLRLLRTSSPASDELDGTAVNDMAPSAAT